MAPEPVERDSRGILDPWLLRERVRLTRYPPPPALDGLVDRFWAVTWDLPDGLVHRQQVLTHPAVNVTVGNADARDGADGVEARLTGVGRDLTERAMSGRGWTVAAMTTPGGFGAFTPRPVSVFTGRFVAPGEALEGLDDGGLARRVTDAGDEKARVAVLAETLAAHVDPERARLAREVASIARLAETDRSLRRLEDLCARAGMAPRALQRAFLRCAGVSPTWVLRRYRLLDAAESVRDGAPVVWAEVATDLGYADQAHLSRDFTKLVGEPPTAYAERYPRRPGVR